jgi:S1-C subfamily serine protease
MRVTVEITRGARAGQRLEFERPLVRFGRHPTNDVVFDAEEDRDASARHAELRPDPAQPEALVLVDLGSANGTRLDGVAVNGSGVALPDGGEIEFGRGGPVCRVRYSTLACRGDDKPTVRARGGREPSTVRDPQQPGASAEVARSLETELAAEDPDTLRSAAPPEVPSLPSSAPAAARGVGPGTVARMIDAALGRSSARTTLALGLVAVVTAIAVLFGQRLRLGSDARLRQRMVALKERQLTESDAGRARLQAQLDALQAKLSKGSGAAIARASRDAIFLLAARGARGDEQGFCTAFAIDATHLVTNAHCVVAASDLRLHNDELFVVQNGHPGVRLRVTGISRLRAFDPDARRVSPDVGRIEVEGPLSANLALADQAELERLAPGDPMFTYGFPGELANLNAPEATFVEGVIGRVTTLEGVGGAPAEQRLIQHSAFSSAGTSGSPIFDAAGHVIAVNTGGYTGERRGGLVGRALPGYNFGMRIDLLQGLFSEGGK